MSSCVLCFCMLRRFKALKGIRRLWIQKDRSVEISYAFEKRKL